MWFFPVSQTWLLKVELDQLWIISDHQITPCWISIIYLFIQTKQIIAVQDEGKHYSEVQQKIILPISPNMVENGGKYILKKSNFHSKFR